MSVPKYNGVRLEDRWTGVEDLSVDVEGYFAHVGEDGVRRGYENKNGETKVMVVDGGCSPGGLAAWLGIGMRDYGRLCKGEEFERFWGYMDWVHARMEDRLLKMAGGGVYNPKALDMVMKNRFGYTDKVEKTNRSLSINVSYTEVGVGGVKVALEGSGVDGVLDGGGGVEVVGGGGGGGGKKLLRGDFKDVAGGDGDES